MHSIAVSSLCSNSDANEWKETQQGTAFIPCWDSFQDILIIIMTINKISGGSARAGQLMQLLFFVPFSLILLYLTLVNFSFGIFLFFTFCSAIMSLVLYIGLSYRDLYLTGDYLIIKKIFTSQKVNLSEIVEIEKALLPFTYYLKFKNNQTVYFTSKLGDFPRFFFSMDSEKGLKELKAILDKQIKGDTVVSKTGT